MVNVRSLHGLFAVALTATYITWLVIANLFSSDSGVYTVKFSPPSPSEDLNDKPRYLLSVNNISGLSIQLIGSIASLLFLYYADYVPSRGAALVSFWTSLLFATAWLASHAYYMVDGFYERDGAYTASLYSRVCTSSFTSLNVAYSRTTDALMNECNAVRGGAALSVIAGIVQGGMVAYSMLQIVAGTSDANAPRSFTRMFGYVALFFIFIGQVLRAAASLRVAQQYKSTEDLVLFTQNDFQFFSGPVDFQSSAPLAIQLQTLGTAIAFACIVHSTAGALERPTAPDPYLSPKATGIIGFMVAIVIAFYTTTVTIWDGRALLELIGNATAVCGDNSKCDTYKTGFSGEVIIAFGSWVLAFAALVALKLSREVKNTGDRSFIHGVLVLAVFVAFIGLVSAFFVSNFIAAVTYTSNGMLALNAGGSVPFGSVHNLFLFAALWAIFSIGTYVYWYYSTSNAAAYACFYGSGAIAAGWLISQYFATRALGTQGEGPSSLHATYCPGQSESFTASDDTICRLTTVPGVITLLFGIGEAGVAGLMFLGALYAMIGGRTGDDGSTNIQQKLLFVVSWGVLVGFVVWNVTLFGALPNSIYGSNRITYVAVYSLHIVLMVLTVLSIFGAFFVATTKDVGARSRALPFSFLTTGAAIMLGWIAIPVASYSLEHILAGSTGACFVDKGADVCSAARTGVAGLYIHVIANSASLLLQGLLAFTTGHQGANPS